MKRAWAKAKSHLWWMWYAATIIFGPGMGICLHVRDSDKSILTWICACLGCVISCGMHDWVRRRQKKHHKEIMAIRDATMDIQSRHIEALQAIIYEPVRAATRQDQPRLN